jgi:hypothetical protein
MISRYKLARLAIYGALSLVSVGITSMPQADQYDVAARRRELDGWEVRLKAFYERVAYISFAYGCKIIKHPAQVWLLLEAPYNGFNQQAVFMNLRGYDYRRFNPQYKAAGRAGFERSQIAGQCDYWNANTDEAIALRGEAIRLMNYIGPADAHPQLPQIFR